MSPAKVTLSPKERELVNDPGWILTKNGIIQKVYVLFGELSRSYDAAVADSSLRHETDIFRLSPKISKGEQYEGLPWVMLDQIRCYHSQDAFGIRTFFWWGNSVSITLHLSGKYQQKYESSIRRYFEQTSLSNWWVSVGDDPWHHHFRADNYQPADAKLIAQPRAFLKIVKSFPLQDWDDLPNLLQETFREMLSILSA